MPRVGIKKMEYKKRDLKNWIAGQMRANGLRQEDVGRELGISQQAVSQKLKLTKTGPETDPISYGDLLALFKLFGTTGEEIQKLMSI